MFLETAEDGFGTLDMECRDRVEDNPIIKVRASGIQARTEALTGRIKALGALACPCGILKDGKGLTAYLMPHFCEAEVDSALENPGNTFNVKTLPSPGESRVSLIRGRGHFPKTLTASSRL